MDYIEPQPLVDMEDLVARLEWTMDDDEARLAEASLEDLSDDARFYGSHAWKTPESTPRQVKSLVARAVARHLRNPDGFTVSRAGDETVGWTDKGDDGGVLAFTEREQKTLRQIAGKGGLTSVRVVAWGERDPVREGFVPTVSGTPFPYYSSDSSPW